MKEKILEIMSEKKYQPLDVDGFCERLELTTSSEFVNLVKNLNELEDEYIIYHNRKNCFAKLKDLHLVVGVIDVKEAGFGFVKVDDELFQKDIYINQTNRHTALSGDKVLVRYFLSDVRYEGVVEKIIARATSSVVGVLKKYHKKYYVESLDVKKPIRLLIDKSSITTDVEVSKVVRAQITKYFPDIRDLIMPIGEGKITEVFGSYEDPGMDILSLVYSKQLPIDFSKDTIDEVSTISQTVKKEQLKERVDKTKIDIVTIDGDDAKDLDDAIHVEKLENGNYLLGVYIADVSEYVKDSSFIDQEAFMRGTSVYLPNQVIPMLPKELSNGICSLNEGVLRLVMGCEMEIDNSGIVVNSNIFKGYIKTKARLTYKIVNQILENENSEEIKRYLPLVDMLKIGAELAQILYQMRIDRGAFDFDTMESAVVLDDNLKAVDIIVRERKQAEKMIEEFMLIANEAVASTMKWLDVPFIYRVHDQPKEEKITNFIQYASMLGLEIDARNAKTLANSLQKIFLSTKEDEDTSSKIIHTMLLRSMAKAKYQMHNIGHYGLASSCYTHFTSPIRRYPDLLVHRLIKQFLLNENQVENNALGYFLAYVNATSEQSSNRERIAESIERDALDIKKAEYMQSQIGKKYPGTISSVTGWGCYVMLDNSVEGLVRFENLPNDFYHVNEKHGLIQGKRTGQTFTIGERVEVRVLSANKKLHQIDLKLIKKLKR